MKLQILYCHKIESPTSDAAVLPSVSHSTSRHLPPGDIVLHALAPLLVQLGLQLSSGMAPATDETLLLRRCHPYVRGWIYYPSWF